MHEGRIVYFVPWGQASPTTTTLIVIGFGVLGLGGLYVGLLLAFVDRWRTARALRSMERAPFPPPAGRNCIVTGTIVDDAGDGPLTLRIRQTGTTWRTKNGAEQHTWREVERELRARPFQLQVDDGRWIRVEPGPQPKLMGPLDGSYALGPAERTRTLDVRAGDRIYLLGSVEQLPSGTFAASLTSSASAKATPTTTSQLGGADELLVVRPPSDRPMVVSKGSIAAQHAARARRYGLAMGLTGLVVLLTHGWLFRRYHVLRWAGQVVQTPVIGTSTWNELVTTGTRNHQTTRSEQRYGLELRHPDTVSLPLTVRVSRRWYERARGGATMRLPCVWRGADAQVGHAATESTDALFVFTLGSVTYVVLLGITLFNGRPWYERKRVDDDGAGPLDASRADDSQPGVGDSQSATIVI